MLEHSSSSSHISSICVTSCRKPSTIPHCPLCWRGSVQMRPSSQLLLYCSISSCSYLFATYVTGFIKKTAAPFLVWLHVQNLSLTHHEHPGNISYNNKFPFSFSLIVRGAGHHCGRIFLLLLSQTVYQWEGNGLALI